MSSSTISINNFADLLGVSRATVDAWIRAGKFPVHEDGSNHRFFYLNDLTSVPEVQAMLTSKWAEEMKIIPNRAFTSAELFAGGGGLALGLEKAGSHHMFLNEFDHLACETLRLNRPNWNVIEGDIHDVDFTPYKDRIDFLSGGFPCQAFSYAGKRLGFEETRGTLFFELARAL